MRMTNKTPSTRQWQRLGNILLDMAAVVKIEFHRPDARLFVVSGEALLMTAWSESRSEVSSLKQLASEANGWVAVTGDARESSDEAEVFQPDSGSSSYPVPDNDEDPPAPQPTSIDQRVRIAAVDRLIYINTSAGKAVELFSSGVFLGQVFDPETIGFVESAIEP